MFENDDLDRIYGGKNGIFQFGSIGINASSSSEQKPERAVRVSNVNQTKEMENDP